MIWIFFNILQLNKLHSWLNQGLIFLTARALGYSEQNAAYLVAQAQHETGDFKSDLFVRARNAFGMRKAYKRKQSIKGETTNRYVTYHNVIQSLYDRYLWDKEFNIPINEDIPLLEYVYRLKSKGYFEANKVDYHLATAVFLQKFQNEGENNVMKTLARVSMSLGFLTVLIYFVVKWKS